MALREYFDKENLHHAYLIEGEHSEILPNIQDFLKEIGVSTSGNPDYVHMRLDSFKVDDARNLKALGIHKSFSPELGSGKRIFVISANSFLLEAQNSLLKLFEEPVQDTHFFLIVPDKNALLRTLVSRFYVISPMSDVGEGVLEAEKFISMPLRSRIDHIKELLAEPDEEDEEDGNVISLDSARSKALRFLNSLESVLHTKLIEDPSPGRKNNIKEMELCFEHLFKVREFLRMPGSSLKSMMESVALMIPIL